ncbi:type I secretion system permease/ATPase [Bradyrhizobium sp.]|uniref:type I secretion system permease/ATPase n=1 Tax=Bradyrhizobium sp. TaxID=376 RepID=UPI0039E49AFD
MSLPPVIRDAFVAVRGALLATAMASSLVNLLMLVGPIFMLQVYDRVLPSRSIATLVGLLLIALVLLVIQAGVDMLRSRLLARIAEIFDETVRRGVFDSVHHDAIGKPDRGGLQIMRDLDTVRGFIAGSGLIVVSDLPWTPLYILVCTLFHPLMGLAVTGGAIALAAITVAAEMFTRAPIQSLVALASSRRQAAETAFHHATVVHALGMTSRMADLWSERSQAYLDAQRVSSDLTGAFGGASRFLRMILQSGVLALGAYLVINQQATAGVMLAATILSIRALAPIELAIANWRGFIAARASFTRLIDALNAVPAKPPLTPLPRPKQEIRVTSLSLTAPGTDRVVLHDVSFALRAGSAVAIVGPSGSGKSTLARALVGVGAPARGVIRIDGASLAHWDPLALGPAIGFLPQDVALFRGTVAQNISRFAVSPDADRLIAAAHEADVHDVILRLPGGYETEVGDGGLMLSGGQRQRIALARALYGDPFLIVLDEPNSNLDSEGERALIRAILRARARGSIVVVIAHRPTVLQAVDHMLVLNEGRLHTFGTTRSVLPSLAPKAAEPAAAEPAIAEPTPARAPARRRSRKQMERKQDA